MSVYFDLRIDHLKCAIIQIEQKPCGAYQFLERLISKMKYYNFANESQPLTFVVDSVVAGYEAKAGFFQRIWSCVLRIFARLGICPEPKIDAIRRLADEIKHLEITKHGYSTLFFRDKLSRLKHLLEKYNFPSVGQYGKSVRNLYENFTASVKNYDQNDLSQIKFTFDMLFFILAERAFKEGRFIEAALDASKIQYLLSDEHAQLFVQIVDECLKLDCVTLAQMAVSQVYLKKVDLQLKIAEHIYAKSKITETDICLLIGILKKYPYQQQRLVNFAVSKSIENGFYSLAMTAAKLTPYDANTNERLLEIADIFYKKEQYNLALEALDGVVLEMYRKAKENCIVINQVFANLFEEPQK